MLKDQFPTDKFDLGYWDHLYKNIVYNISPRNILEIGVCYGHSILLLNHLFPNANIYALDINQCDNILNREKIKHIIGNAYSSEISDQFNDNFFDLIIDDGPHTFESFELLIQQYHKKLTGHGTMIIEDVITKDISNKLSDLLQANNIPYKILHMAGKQKTETLLNKWKDHLDVFLIWR